jgi:hypothetical protein
VGKTFDVGGIVFADSIISPGTTTVWTAHRFAVARESFNELRALARTDLLAPHIDADDITSAAGNECIPFRNGSRIMFKARERGAIRGFTKVRRLVLDEAQILTEAAMADMVATMNQAENPQAILMGTPPKPTDPSEVFTNLRTEALSGDSDGVLYVEFSADPDSDPGSPTAWRQANPSYPKRTPRKAILRMRKLLSPDDFAREALGIWVDGNGQSAIDPAAWAACADPDSTAVGSVAFAVDVTPDRDRASVTAVGRRSDGLLHGELIANEPGTAWVVPKLVELVAKWSPLAVGLDPAGPAGSLLTALTEAGIEVTSITTREAGQACGALYDDIVDGAVRHRGDPELTAAVGAARTRKLGDSWVWARRGTADLSPLVALTVARFVFLTNCNSDPAIPEAIIL